MKRDPRSAGKTPSLLQEQQLLNEQDRNLRDNVPSLSPDQRREMLEDNQRILSRMPPHEFAERLQRRLQEEEHSQPGDARIFNLATFRAAALAAAAASVILIGMLFVLPLQQRGSINVDGDVIRLKGAELRLQVFRQQPDGDVQQLSPGDRVREGEQIQLAYRSAGPDYGIIASVDGRGTISLHHPFGIFDSPQIETGSQILLPYAFRLDDAPRHEQLIFIASAHEFDVQAALRWIKDNLDESNRLRPDAEPPFADGVLRFFLEKNP
ncbi:hypothetical protein Spiaf_1463 [Spirochaeta africana DSM 8902]|uniref:DUF4384 domain-containing protein n=2 Tax=Spirochaeta TaxID=146 RepID=H9UJ33_SPIAZ|nr:hypothetical protein Spiaf_1463 [Spirochaeta africana DSM 8902]